jgi:hypothetical protein
MSIAETSFAEATEEFKKFLAENNLPSEILWVFLEDTFYPKVEFIEKHFRLKLPLPDENEKLAETLYRVGRQRNFGICLTAFALCEEKVCCAVVVPKDEKDSEYMMTSPEHLKFTIVVDMPAARAVRSSFRWKLFRLLPFKYRQGNSSGYLPSKKDLQFSSV